METNESEIADSLLIKQLRRTLKIHEKSMPFKLFN